MLRGPITLTLSLPNDANREAIYALRHEIYATELEQHPQNALGLLRDWLDEINVYVVARDEGGVVGFVSITPPNSRGYSIDRYFPREGLGLIFDQGLYEVRLLTVRPGARRSSLALLLMYAALRYVESRGGRAVAAIGRVEVLKMYRQAGFALLGARANAGKVTYELMSASVRTLRARAQDYGHLLTRFEKSICWQLAGVPFHKPVCFHGGAFFEAIGDDFQTLENRNAIINADVLDAWFDPAPAVVKQLSTHLKFAVKTSPPTGCAGMIRAIARARQIEPDSIMPGAGSSDLIFAGLRQWISPSSSVLILDPMYGEYAHVLEQLIGARVDRFALSASNNYDIDVDAFASRLARPYDWVVLVNPNSPTGRFLPRAGMERLVALAPPSTRWWIDETYVDYVDSDQSLERYAARSTNVVVCKSMSKAYALSGVRAAYLCGPPYLMDALRPLSPPWSVSLPGQMAACAALQSTDYYKARWEETHRLREDLAEGLRGLGWDVVPGCANFLLCHLPSTAPEAPMLVARARERGLFVRDISSMGSTIDRRTIRVAVKDRDTNLAMLEILRLIQLERTRSHEPRSNRLVRRVSRRARRVAGTRLGRLVLAAAARR